MAEDGLADEDSEAAEAAAVLDSMDPDAVTVEVPVDERSLESVVVLPDDDDTGVGALDAPLSSETVLVELVDGDDSEAVFEDENREYAALEEEIYEEEGHVPDLFELRERHSGNRLD